MPRFKKRRLIITSLLLVCILMISIKSYKPYYFIKAQKVEKFSEESSIELDSISVATFNAGILHAKIFGQTIIEPVPFSEKRLNMLAAYLMTLDVDVIGVQEIYNIEDKDQLIREVQDKYPYAVYFKRKQLLKLGLNNGLMFLSRYPFSKALFEKYDKNPITDKIMADKGIMSITIGNGKQNLIISNAHTTAGGVIYDTESNKANKIRMNQIKQSIEMTELLAKEGDIKMILGDFNAGPGVSEVNYLFMEENGYIDSYRSGCADNCELITWDPENKLNANGHFPNSPAQRIDHIFIKTPNGHNFNVFQTGVILQDEVVLVDNNERVSLSDHYGYFCSISLK